MFSLRFRAILGLVSLPLPLGFLLFPRVNRPSTTTNSSSMYPSSSLGSRLPDSNLAPLHLLPLTTVRKLPAHSLGRDSNAPKIPIHSPISSSCFTIQIPDFDLLNTTSITEFFTSKLSATHHQHLSASLLFPLHKHTPYTRFHSPEFPSTTKTSRHQLISHGHSLSPGPTLSPSRFSSSQTYTNIPCFQRFLLAKLSYPRPRSRSLWHGPSLSLPAFLLSPGFSFFLSSFFLYFFSLTIEM